MIVTRAKAEEAALLLGLSLDGLTGDAIGPAYRTAAKDTHPDAGGKPEDFARVDWAKHALLEWLKKPEASRAPRHVSRPCDNCKGKGFIQTMQGFKMGPRKQCQPCRGTGDADFEPDEGESR